MRTKSAASPSCQLVREHPAWGCAELSGAAPEKGARRSRTNAGLLHYSSRPPAGERRLPRESGRGGGPGHGLGAPAARAPLEAPGRGLSPHRHPHPAPPRAKRGSSGPPVPPGSPAHLDPLHGGLQLQLLHQALHGAQAAGRRHDGDGQERDGAARLGSALPGSAGTAGAARGRGRGRSAPRSDPRVMISIFHPRLRLYSFEMPL